MSSNQERTFIAIKPDGVQRGLVHEIIRRFENKGYRLVAIKMVQATPQLLEEHYAEHKGKAFLPGLVKYMSSSPLVAMVWEGSSVIAEGRRILGATRPKEAAMGTIRGDYGIDVGRNLAHGSDGKESAEREVALWFKPEELCKWQRCSDNWLYE